MDNDLMALRRRPSSDPAQQASDPQQPEQPTERPSDQPHGAPSWPPTPQAAPWEQTAQPIPQYPEFTPTATVPPAWNSQQRDEIPWDRPTDLYDAWNEPVSAGASFAPVIAAPAAAPVGPPMQVPTHVDPDDSQAPVLSDVSRAKGRTWPEANVHDHARNAPVPPENGRQPMTRPSDPRTAWPQPASAEAHQPPSELSPGPSFEAQQSFEPAPASVQSAPSPVQPAASDAAAASAEPLVVRIELTIVHEVSEGRNARFAVRARAMESEAVPIEFGWLEPTPEHESYAAQAHGVATTQPQKPAPPIAAPRAASRMPVPVAAQLPLPTPPIAAQPGPTAGLFPPETAGPAPWLRQPAPGYEPVAQVSRPPSMAVGDDIEVDKEPSTLMTTVLTVGMAVLVIVLVLVFIQLMTSLLR